MRIALCLCLKDLSPEVDFSFTWGSDYLPWQTNQFLVQHVWSHVCQLATVISWRSSVQCMLPFPFSPVEFLWKVSESYELMVLKDHSFKDTASGPAQWRSFTSSSWSCQCSRLWSWLGTHCWQGLAVWGKCLRVQMGPNSALDHDTQELSESLDL